MKDPSERAIRPPAVGEDVFRGALEAAPDPILITDERGTILLVNAQVEKVFGYPRTELLGKQVEVLVPPRFRPHHPVHRSGFFHDPRVRPMGEGRELFAARRDGSEFPVEISLSPLETASGRVVVSVIRDITERKRAEQKFRGLLESAPDAMVIVGVDGTISLVNSQTERLFGYSRAELLGKKVEVLVPDRFRERHPAHRDKFIHDPVPREMGAGLDLFARRKDGTEFPVEISLSPLETSEGTIVSSSIRDVTDRRRAEAALKESEARFSKLFQSTPMPLSLTHTKERRFVEVNEAFLKLLGMRREDIIARTAEELGISSQNRIDDIRTRLASEGHVRAARIEMRRPDGTTRIADLSIEPIVLNGEGYLAVSYDDITDRLRVEAEIRRLNAELEERVKERTAELERSNAELQQFAYVASHDLQEPLRTVSGAVMRIARRYDDKLDPEGREFIRFALEGTARMRSLIEDLLALSRVGSQGRERTPTSSQEALEQAIASLRAGIAESKAQIDAQPLPPVLADPSQLAQLFQNLLANAIKFKGSSAPRIEIDAEGSGRFATFSVRDHGIGLDPKHKERVFVIFQRLDPTTPGTGIGLAIAKKIVERHGGRIWVEPTPGGGATFVFTIPLAEPRA